MAATQSVLLRAEGNWLIIRTTTGDQDCLLVVNAYDVEGGLAITRASYIREFAWDTGGMATIGKRKRKLYIDYEDFAGPKLGLLKDDMADMFPAMVEVETVARLDAKRLFEAAAHTAPMAITGAPIKSAVHMVPGEDGTAIFGTDGVIGYYHLADSQVGQRVSIAADLLSAAISAIPGTVEVGVAGYRVGVSAVDSPAHIQFSTLSCPDPSNILNMFRMPHEDAPEITKAKEFQLTGSQVKKIQFLCGKAAAVDEASEVMFHGREVILAEILGQDVEIPETEVCSGSIDPIVFLCSSLSRALGKLVVDDDYTVTTFLKEGKPHFWYVDGATGRHFMMACAPQRFKEDEDG